MIFININKLNPSQKWLAKANDLLLELKKYKDDKDKRDEIIDKNHSFWKKLKGDLKELNFGKCWYSDAHEIYSHYHVDHFRPKKKAVDIDGSERDGYWWLAFEYTNYRLSGSVGNTKKGDFFAVKSNCAICPEDNYEDEIIYFLDPTKKNDFKKLNFDESGKIIPSNPNKNHWENKKAIYTIDKLHLDYPDLEEARRIKWKKTKTLIDEVDIAEAEYNENPSTRKEEKLENKLEEVRKILAPDEELLSTVRACLRASRKDWARHLLEENIGVA